MLPSPTIPSLTDEISTIVLTPISAHAKVLTDYRKSPVISISHSAEPRSLRSDWRPTGRAGRSAPSPLQSKGLACLHPKRRVLLPRHKSGTVGATSRLAPVVRGRPGSHPVVGDARAVHRQLNRRDNPRTGSGKCGSQYTLRPAARPVDGKRKPGRVHARGSGYNRGAAKAPPSRSDRPPQGGRERVGRGSLQIPERF